MSSYNRKRRTNDTQSAPYSGAKRTRTAPTSTARAASSGDGQALGGAAIDDEGNTYWEISKLRRVTISEFKGKTYIGIREYFEKDGKQCPGKKGISLSIDQLSSFVNILPQLDLSLSAVGQTITRPNYGGAPNLSTTSDPNSTSTPDLSKPEEQDQKPTRPKKSAKPFNSVTIVNAEVDDEDENDDLDGKQDAKSPPPVVPSSSVDTKDKKKKKPVAKTQAELDDEEERLRQVEKELTMGDGDDDDEEEDLEVEKNEFDSDQMVTLGKDGALSDEEESEED